MVEVKGFGFGVVQWVGKMAGTNTAGIELVTPHTLSHSPNVPLPCSRRSSVTEVEMELQREGLRHCFHANLVTVCSVQSRNWSLTPDS